MEQERQLSFSDFFLNSLAWGHGKINTGMSLPDVLSSLPQSNTEYLINIYPKAKENELRITTKTNPSKYDLMSNENTTLITNEIKGIKKRAEGKRLEHQAGDFVVALRKTQNESGEASLSLDIYTSQDERQTVALLSDILGKELSSNLTIFPPKIAHQKAA